jgi:hypothetical protein
VDGLVVEATFAIEITEFPDTVGSVPQLSAPVTSVAAVRLFVFSTVTALAEAPPVARASRYRPAKVPESVPPTEYPKTATPRLDPGLTVRIAPVPVVTATDASV